jgi:Ca2+-binding EF-hand superfamily protein
VATTEAPLEHKLRYAFNVYDLDHNSMIDRAEILFILRAMFQLLGMNDDKSHKYSYEQCADTIMKNLDVNEDQRLSKEEFIQGLKQDPFLRGLMNPFQND